MTASPETWLPELRAALGADRMLTDRAIERAPDPEGLLDPGTVPRRAAVEDLAIVGALAGQS